MRIGCTSRAKLTGTSAVAFSTLTGMLAFVPPASTDSVLLPSATGRTTPLSAVATFAFALVTVAVRVKSQVRPSAHTPSTITRCSSRGPTSLTAGGYTTSFAGAPTGGRGSAARAPVAANPRTQAANSKRGGSMRVPVSG